MKLIEKFMESKSGNVEECEDGLFINENYIAVVDGATSKGNITWDGKTSGRYTKDIILDTLPKLDENVDAAQAIQAINNNIKKAYKDNYETAKVNFAERLLASIIIFSVKKQEIWSFGDCQCIINEKLYSHEKKVDKVLSEVRSLYISLSLMGGKTEQDIISDDIGREYILPILKKQSIFANSNNTEYGFDVLDGFDINVDNIKIYKVQKGDEIVLASDGYPKLQNTLKASEKILEETLKSDPLLINIYKSTKCLNKQNKSFDDRTYVKFVV
jgi:hypothetical protein